jgi:hypothetical protein
LAREAPLAEEVLDGKRLAPYLRGCARALLAALLALDWAEVDRDRVPAEISLAALLNNLGELYLLAHGDARINRYLTMMEHARVLPHEAEYVTLGESLEELGYGLAAQWGLPEMVRESMRARNAQHLRPLCVMLATQIARYAFSGWIHPRQLADLRLVAELLDLDAHALRERIDRVLREFNRRAPQYGLSPLAALPLDEEEAGAGLPVADATRQALFCLAPRLDDFQRALERLTPGRPAGRDAIIRTLLRGLHRGLGLNRVVFAVYDPATRSLIAEQMVGTDFEPGFNRFRLSIDQGGLFGRLLARPLELWVGEGARNDLWPEVPMSVRNLTGVDRFFVRSLWRAGQPLGLVYADRRSSDCDLDERGYQGFLRLVALAETCLERA